MTLKRRIERLSEKVPSPETERPTEIFLVGICPETQEAVSAYSMCSGQSLERMAGEIEAAFKARLAEF